MLEDADDDDFQGADITILPPAANASNDTGCDSDDEMVATADLNRLNRNQLLAEASARVQRREGVTRTILDLQGVESSDAQLLAKKEKRASACKATTQKKQPKVKLKVKLAEYQPSWIKKDLNLAHGKTKFPWKAPTHEIINLSPVSLFESIFTPALMELICKEQ